MKTENSTVLWAIQYVKTMSESPLKEVTPEKSEPYHWALWALSKVLPAGAALELGVKYGNGVYHMAGGDSVARPVYGIDKKLTEEAQVLFKDKPNVALVEFDSVEWLRMAADVGELRFVLGHVDTEHTPEQVGAELDALFPLMPRGGVIAVDDIDISSEMRRWWYKMQHDYRVETIAAPELHVTGHGYLVKR